MKKLLPLPKRPTTIRNAAPPCSTRTPNSIQAADGRASPRRLPMARSTNTRIAPMAWCARKSLVRTVADISAMSFRTGRGRPAFATASIRFQSIRKAAARKVNAAVSALRNGLSYSSTLSSPQFSSLFTQFPRQESCRLCSPSTSRSVPPRYSAWRVPLALEPRRKSSGEGAQVPGAAKAARARAA